MKNYEIVDGVEKLEAAIARVRAAQQRFALYRRCTRAYCRLWERGLSLEALTVTCKAKERLCESCRKQQ